MCINFLGLCCSPVKFLFSGLNIWLHGEDGVGAVLFLLPFSLKMCRSFSVPKPQRTFNFLKVILSQAEHTVILSRSSRGMRWGSLFKHFLGHDPAGHILVHMLQVLHSLLHDFVDFLTFRYKGNGSSFTQKYTFTRDYPGLFCPSLKFCKIALSYSEKCCFLSLKISLYVRVGWAGRRRH